MISDWLASSINYAGVTHPVLISMTGLEECGANGRESYGHLSQSGLNNLLSHEGLTSLGEERTVSAISQMTLDTNTKPIL